MKEIIRKAVGYADGWRLNKTGQVTSNGGYFGHIEDQEILDALATQLRRQINAMEDCEVVVDKRHVTAYKIATPIQAFGPDETENSLRACVEFYEDKDDD